MEAINYRKMTTFAIYVVLLVISYRYVIMDNIAVHKPITSFYITSIIQLTRSLGLCVLLCVDTLNDVRNTSGYGNGCNYKHHFVCIR